MSQEETEVCHEDEVPRKKIKKEVMVTDVEKEIETSPPNKRDTSKRSGNWYKQSFRFEWMKIPDFRGWLEPDNDDKCGAYCSVCDIKMKSVNKSTLRTHSACVKHLKALAKKKAAGLYDENSYIEDDATYDVDDHHTVLEVIPADKGSPIIVRYPTPKLSQKYLGKKKPENGKYQASALKTKKTVGILVDFKEKYGLTLSQTNSLISLFKIIFPDSIIAQGLTTIRQSAKKASTSPGTNSVLSNQVSKPAPSWEGTAVIDGQFKELKLEDFRGKYLVFFFYPLDFTFVCPTEILAFNDRIDEFHALNAEVVACSIDSHFTHLAWTKTARKEGGLGNLDIPLLSDITHRISIDYGVYLEDQGIALRGLFIIDDKGILRQITMNDLPVGRSVDETLRLVQAFQFTDEHGEVCPAGWKPGDDTIIPNPQEKLKYFKKANQ